jgi:hypothetical protein
MPRLPCAGRSRCRSTSTTLWDTILQKVKTFCQEWLGVRVGLVQVNQSRLQGVHAMCCLHWVQTCITKKPE